MSSDFTQSHNGPGAALIFYSFTCFLCFFISIFLFYFNFRVYFCYFISFSKDHKYFTQRTITAEIALCLSTCSTFWFLSQNHETRKMKNQKCIFFCLKIDLLWRKKIELKNYFVILAIEEQFSIFWIFEKQNWIPSIST